MARQVGSDEQEQQEKSDERSIIGMTKARLKATLARLRGNATERTQLNESRGEILNKAIDTDHAHKGALLMAFRLDKMEAVKRNEWLYHFDLYRGHMGWDTSDLLRKETEPSRQGRERSEAMEQNEPQPELA